MQFKFYLVGGFVRDQLLGIKSNDMDYIVVSNFNESIDIVYEKFCDYLLNQNYIIYLKTPECYTVRAKLNNKVDDFVLARKEIGYNKDSRKPIIESGSIYDDLQRRDFTINAMAIDVETGELIDPFNGQKDLKNKKLKTVIDLNISLLNDPLRLLRGLRFSITLDFKLSKKFMAALSNQEIWDKFYLVSVERTRDEFEKMFKFNTLKTLDLLFMIKDMNLNAYQILLNRIVLKPLLK